MNATSHRLIFSFVVMGTLLLPASNMSAQSAPDTGFVAPRTTAPKTETTVIEKPSGFDITGVIAQAFNMKRPLRMISPLAPAKEGNGRENVSWDPDKPEKPKGIILFGIQW